MSKASSKSIRNGLNSINNTRRLNGGKKRNERNTKETNRAAVHYLLYMAYETFRWLVQEEEKPAVKISFVQPELSPNGLAKAMTAKISDLNYELKFVGTSRKALK